MLGSMLVPLQASRVQAGPQPLNIWQFTCAAEAMHMCSSGKSQGKGMLSGSSSIVTRMLTLRLPCVRWGNLLQDIIMAYMPSHRSRGSGKEFGMP